VAHAWHDARHGQLRASGHHGDGGLGAAWRVMSFFNKRRQVDGISMESPKNHGFVMVY